jgi:mevalonate pyrophosphate decarboxylase
VSLKREGNVKYGGHEWSEQLKSATREAIAEAVADHRRKGNPVYFTDDAGCLCVIMPDGHERRLTDDQIDALTR